jgi:hypothetical protein
MLQTKKKTISNRHIGFQEKTKHIMSVQATEQAPVVPVAPVERKSKNPFVRNKALIAAIVVPIFLLLVVGISVGVYYANKSSSAKPNPPPPPPPPPPLSAPVFDEYTKPAPPVWCPTQYSVRTTTGDNVDWTDWSTATPATNTQGQPRLKLAWAATLTQAERLLLQWRRRLNTASSTDLGQPVQMSVSGPDTFIDETTSPCAGPAPEKPAAPVFDEYTQQAPPLWCPTQYSVRNPTGQSTEWSNWSIATAPTATQGKPRMLLTWAADLTPAQRLLLEWRRRLNTTSDTALGLPVQMTVTGPDSFVDNTTTPCDQPIPDDEPGVPELVRFDQTSDFYWARRTWFKAGFPSGSSVKWSDWSFWPVFSTYQQKGTVPVLRVRNSATVSNVMFQRLLEPLPGETGFTTENVTLTRVSGPDATLFSGGAANNRVPLYRYIRVISGTVADGGRNQGLSFYINRNNQQAYVITLAQTAIGVWSLTELLDVISNEFALAPAAQRVTGLAFTPVSGTPLLRMYTAAGSSWPENGLTPFRVCPYQGGLNTCTTSPPVCYLPNEAVNGGQTLNRLLGFGLIPTTSPQVSGTMGQIGYWGPTFATQPA